MRMLQQRQMTMTILMSMMMMLSLWITTTIFVLTNISSSGSSSLSLPLPLLFVDAYTSPTLTTTTTKAAAMRITTTVTQPRPSMVVGAPVTPIHRYHHHQNLQHQYQCRTTSLHSVLDAEVIYHHTNHNIDDAVAAVAAAVTDGGEDTSVATTATTAAAAAAATITNTNQLFRRFNTMMQHNLRRMLATKQRRRRRWWWPLLKYDAAVAADDTDDTDGVVVPKPRRRQSLRLILTAATVAFTVMMKLSPSSLSLPSSSTFMASSPSEVTTTILGTHRQQLPQHHQQQQRLLATTTTTTNSIMNDAAVTYVQRGGTTSTTTTTATAATTTGSWFGRSTPTTTKVVSTTKKTPSTTSIVNNKKKGNHRNNNNNKKNANDPFVEEMIQMERAVEHGVVVASTQTSKTFVEAIHDLHQYMAGPKSDTLLLLLATSLITPLCQRVNLSPILGFLASGMIMGPNGFGVISGIHTTETLAELGIVFFLFEMGIELSFNRLKSMRRDVFGLGLAQFVCTAMIVAGVGTMVGLPANANVVLGGGIALSSSAFVLQLLKDKNQLATRFGKASFGVLLFQDLAVVPLLVVTPILAGNGAGLATALTSALVKAAMALSSIAIVGRYVLNPLFKTVAQAQSQEAFLGVVLLTVLSMSFMTEGLGLSNTLGAFLAGVLLSETKYRYQVEADIAPFRGILLGLFFVTVGFEIDVKLIASNLPLVGSLVFGIIAIKAAVTTALSLAFGLSLATSQQTGLMLSQGGEFAFVAFGLARSLGILDKPTTKLMLTSVSLTMALTPLMATLGSKIAKRLEERTDATHYLGQDRDANEIKESDDFTVVVGYGIVGKVVCDLLDRKFLRYVGLEVDPNRAIQARNAGLPVFYGDIGRQEVAEAFNVGKANAVVVCIADKAQTNRVVVALRRWYPDLPIFARAVNAEHATRLQDSLNVAAMVPILPTDNILLTLPFGSAVMKSIGVPPEEVNAIVESRRKEIINMRGSNREEEELELLQLGISSETLKDTSGFVNLSVDDTLDEDERYDEQYEMTTEAAWERRKAIEGKSPFVARVIQEVCPESADDEDDDNSNSNSNCSSSSSSTVGTNGVNGEKIVVDAEYSSVNNNNRTVAIPAE